MLDYDSSSVVHDENERYGEGEDSVVNATTDYGSYTDGYGVNYDYGYDQTGIHRQ